MLVFFATVNAIFIASENQPRYSNQLCLLPGIPCRFIVAFSSLGRVASLPG